MDRYHPYLDSYDARWRTRAGVSTNVTSSLTSSSSTSTSTSTICPEMRIDVNDIGRYAPNPCGAVGLISLEAYNSPAFHPGRPRFIPKNYDFDNMYPKVQSQRFGSATSKYWGVASNPDETVYISNRPDRRVYAIDPDHIDTPIWSVGPPQCYSMEKELNRPTGLCYDPNGSRIIVADKDNHRIVLFSKNGRYISHFGVKGHHNGQLCYPWDVDVSPDGNQIAVSDSRNHRIQFFDKFGNYLNKYGVFGDLTCDYKSQFDYPRGITYDNEGKSVFVSDFNLHTTFRIDTASMSCSQIAVRGLKRPQGISMDREGNLVVCDTKKHCLRIFSQGGQTLSVVRNIGTRAFNTPTDIAFLNRGNILVMEMNGIVGVF